MEYKLERTNNPNMKNIFLEQLAKIDRVSDCGLVLTIPVIPRPGDSSLYDQTHGLDSVSLRQDSLVQVGLLRVGRDFL